MYYLLLPSLVSRTAFIAAMKERGVGTVFHYIPLHSSPAGQRFGRSHAPSLPVTDDIADRLVRMPMWAGLEEHMDEVLQAADQVLDALPH
jgi:dTDP-4-amino-4,6-dideoxygalactose transaminase